MATDPASTPPPDDEGRTDPRASEQQLTGGISARVVQTRQRIDASRVGHVQRRLVQADLTNQALILAALALTLLLPLLVTLAALLPLGGSDALPATVGRRLGLSAGAIADLQKLFPTRATVRGSSTGLGTAFTLLSAYAWPTALQRGYEIAWDVTSRGWRGLWRPLVWLTAFVAAGVALLAIPAVSGLAAPLRTLLLVLLGSPIVFLWSWWTQHFLLRGAVGWRLLLPGAIAMTLGLMVLRTVAGFYLSTAIHYNYAQYGPLGIVFMMLTWLVALSVVMLGAPVLGAALDEHRMRRTSARAAAADAALSVTEPEDLPSGAIPPPRSTAADQPVDPRRGP